MNLSKVIYEWQGKIKDTVGIKRSSEDTLYNSFGSKPIKVITGFRRTGKSFLVRQVANRLVAANKYRLENILFLNFEDYELSEVNNAVSLGKVYDFFRSNIATLNEPLLVILDEIQLVKDWDKFLRTIYEKNDNLEIIITGSNSQLLSAEIGTNLAGRFIEFFLYPFSFKEFLIYKNKSIENLSEYYQNKIEIDSFFNEYVSYGGLPEVFDISAKETKLSYISGVLNKVILDDIIKRFAVENIEVFEQLTKYILANTGCLISFAKLANHIGSYGKKIKPETLIKYCQYLTKAFAVFELNKFDWKQHKFFSQSRKYLAIDTGLLSLVRSEKENYYFRVENLVYLELLRRKNKVYFGMDITGKEIDFIVKDSMTEKIGNKIQVCLNLNKENYERELQAFLQADKFIKNSKNILLTLDNSELIEFKGVKISKKNIIEWLIDNC